MAAFLFSSASANEIQHWYSQLSSDRIASTFRLQNVTIHRGPFAFEFKSGNVELTEPVEGKYHSAVFKGEGILHFVPPNPIERDQLYKFAKTDELNEIFRSVVFQFSDTFADELVKSGTESSQSVTGAQNLKQTRKEVREKFHKNVESRILRDIVSGTEGYFLAFVSTSSKGNLLLEYDSEEREEFTIRQYSREFIDTWTSFSSGRSFVSPIDIPYLEVDIDIEGNGDIQSSALLHVTAREDGTRTIGFNLSPLIEVVEVVDQKANPCFFIFEVTEDKVGEPAIRQNRLDVFLNTPMKQGQTEKMEVRYRSTDLMLRLKDRKEFVMYDTTGWYPTFGYLQRSKNKITYAFPSDLELISVGEKKREWVEGKQKHSIWEQTFPVTFSCFTLGEFKHKTVTTSGLPTLDIFMGKVHTGIRFGQDAIDNIASDLINSLHFFHQIYAPYPFPSIVATEIPAYHGQGFPGFLHLSKATFEDTGFRGRDEAFRAHEVSHQWWGHLVGWETYHDQWLSEGFAEFSGALFADATLKDRKQDVLSEIVKAWRSDILHQGNLSLYNFGKPKMTSSMTLGNASGSIWLGNRLSSSISPADYQILVYEKGAYVLYMLRMMMRDFLSNSDETFLEMMRDFVKANAWQNATTEGFRKVAEKHYGSDLGWFFNQWVYGSEVPKYRFRWNVESGPEGKVVLVCQVEQTRVSEDFRMPVPVKIDFGKDRHSVVRILIDAPSKTVRIPLPEKPKNVVFNPFYSVLSND